MKIGANGKIEGKRRIVEKRNSGKINTTKTNLEKGSLE
jgi:hypothetical protein